MTLSTLLLIGPTATQTQATPASVAGAVGLSTIWPWLGGLVSVLALVIAGMMWWFGRGDREVKARLQAFRVKVVVDEPVIAGRKLKATDAVVGEVEGAVSCEAPGVK